MFHTVIKNKIKIKYAFSCFVEMLQLLSPLIQIYASNSKALALMILLMLSNDLLVRL